MFKRLWTVAFLLASAVSTAYAQISWDMPAPYQDTSLPTMTDKVFIKKVGELTNGKLKIVLHATASLYKATEIKRAVQGNQVPIGDFLLGTYENEWAPYGVDSIPFLAANYEESRKLWNAQKPLLAKRLDSQGMLLLYTAPWQPQGIFVKDKFNSMDYFKGKKWRSYAPAISKMGELLGAQPILIQGADLAQAVSTGMVEVVITSTDTGYRTRVGETLPYFYDFQAWLPKDIVVVNKKAFNSLDEATKKAIIDAAAFAQEESWAMSVREQSNYDNLVQKEHKVQIIKPTAELKDAMRRQVGQPMLEAWLKNAGKDGKEIIDAYRAQK